MQPANQDAQAGADIQSTDTKKKNPFFALEKVVDAASAKRAARKGALGGLIFAGMYLVGSVFYAMGYSPVSGQQDASFQNDFIIYLIIEAVLIASILFFTWRVSTGRGFISATLLAVWFIVEAVVKITNGATNGGWIFFYLMIGLAMVDGVRGTWMGRKYSKAAAISAAADPTIVRG